MDKLNKLAFIDLSEKRNNLGNKICKELNIEPIDVSINKFLSGEIMININESIRGKDIYLLQTFDKNINEQILEILVTLDALKRASAKEINLILPMFPYSRQDRKAKSREPITAKLMANLFESNGVDRVITLDLHASQVQGFFDIPSDNYFALPILSNAIKEYVKNEDIVIVSPDHGGVTRARKLAESLGSSLAIIDKRRPKPNVSEIMNIIGDVDNKVAIIIDDMIDSAGSLCNASNFLVKNGSKKVYALATHPIFSANALDRIEESNLEKVFVTDSITYNKTSVTNKIEVVSICNLLAKAIEHTYFDKPVSRLFKEGV